MANILITGMTSPQTSSRLGEKSVSFSKAVYDIASENGHNVAFAIPTMAMTRDDLRRYDIIIVGVSPVLSVVANRAYAALHLIDELAGDTRLMFLIDTPAPARITANLRAVEKDFSTIIKQFHSSRPGYESVVLIDKVRSRLASAVSFLANEKWPKTLYPAMPWTDVSTYENALPTGASRSSLVGINPDSYYMKRNKGTGDRTTVNQWVIDNPKTKWASLTTQTLTMPTVPMKLNKGMTDKNVYERVACSVGALISPDDTGGLSWSHRWVQALNANTPIASDWRVTSMLGSAWSHLAAGIEQMSAVDLYELSISQRIEYADAIPTRDTVSELLQQAIGV